MRDIASMDRPVAWWQSQVARVQPAPCPKCGSQTRGEYVVDTSGETRYKRVYRAILERCRCCGWCHAWMTQEQGGPIEVNTIPRSIRPVGVNTSPELTDEEVDQVAKRIKVVRLPGQPLKHRSEVDRKAYVRRKARKALTQNRGN